MIEREASIGERRLASIISQLAEIKKFDLSTLDFTHWFVGRLGVIDHMLDDMIAEWHEFENDNDRKGTGT